MAPEVNFNRLAIDPFSDVLSTAWLDTFHYSPRDIAIRIRRHVKDHIILFKYWVAPSSFPFFDKDSLNDIMHQQFEWIESILGLDFFDLINVEVKNEDSDIGIEFMFYLSEEKFKLAVTLLRIKGYTNRIEQLYPNCLFYNCTSLTSVTFPTNYNWF